MEQLLQSMDQQPVHAQAYEDDIVLLARGRDLGTLHNSITPCLALAGLWADANGFFTFSPSKIEAIDIIWRRRWILPLFLLCGEPLLKSRVKYLRVNLDHKLKWWKHLAQVARVLGPSWRASLKIIDGLTGP